MRKDSTQLNRYIVRFKIMKLPFKVVILAESRAEANKKFMDEYEEYPESIELDDGED